MRFKPFTYLFTLFIGLTVPLAAQDSFTLTAKLSGQQEALPVTTAAVGDLRATFTELNDDEFELVVTGTFSSLSSPVATDIMGGAHLHIAYPGRNGGVELPLVPTIEADGLSGSFTAENNTYTVPTGNFEAADDGAIYFNLHTERNRGGELRGNLVAEDGEVYFTNLFGSNEVPSVLSRASGALVLVYDKDDENLTVTGSFNKLSDSIAVRIGGGVHLHFGIPGRNGPVDIVLSPTLDEDGRGGIFSSDDNTFELSEEQLAALRAGRYYANIHSLTYPSGELRGQVLPPADVLFRAHLSGANEWPVVTSAGSGQVLLHLAGNDVLAIGSLDGLESPLATQVAGGVHLHPGWAGQNGGVLAGLTFDLADDSLSATFPLSAAAITLTDDQRTQMIDRGIYLNVHSVRHLPGELRGQVLPESQAVFTTFLNGNQQIPSVVSTGRGAVKVELMGDRMTATGSFLGLESDLNTAIGGGAHLHAGYPGQSGPVIFPLAVNTEDDADGTSGRFLPADNRFALTEGAKDTLMRRFFYVNIHSLDQPGGEIRGSVLAEAESYFLAPLSGASEPQGVPTDATGMVAAEVVDTTVTLIGSFAGLESDYAFNVMGGMHVHRAIAGSNGDIQALINTEVSDDNRSGTILADSNRITLTSALYDDLRNRLLYANLHTADQPGGEIRGQMLPLAGSYFHASFAGANEPLPVFVFSDAQGGLKAELTDSTLVVTGSVTMLNGDYDASVAGGAHLHVGGAGVNGPISVLLNADVADDLKSATFSADSNRYQLTVGEVNDLRAGVLYANIHTTTQPAGEARGQLLGELNLFPGASTIVSPADDSSLELSGRGDQSFTATFSPSTDVDGDTVVYVWQLATDTAFTDVIFAASTGRDTFFSTDFSTVNALLDSNGVAADATVTLYHRALAGDGSNRRPGVVAAVAIERGDIVGTRDYLPLGFTARTYPNPSDKATAITLEVSTEESFTGQLLLYSQLGQLHERRTVSSPVGLSNYRVRTDRLTAGAYFLVLRKDDGRLMHTSRLMIR